MATNYPTSTSSVTYCAVADVARVLNKATDYFTASTIPSSSSVETFILEAEEQVDRDTQRAWRSRTVTNEYHDINKNTQWHPGQGIRIKLNHRFIKSLSSGSGDKLEVWEGSGYIDFLTNRTEGRGNDFWLDYENGVLYLRNYVYVFYANAIRITYRYGEETVPFNITQATAIHAGFLILNNEDSSFLLSETGETKNQPYDQRLSILQRRYKQILSNFAEVRTITL